MHVWHRQNVLFALAFYLYVRRKVLKYVYLFKHWSFIFCYFTSTQLYFKCFTFYSYIAYQSNNTLLFRLRYRAVYYVIQMNSSFIQDICSIFWVKCSVQDYYYFYNIILLRLQHFVMKVNTKIHLKNIYV